MFDQLIVGTVMIVTSVLVQVSFMAAGLSALHRAVPWMTRTRRQLRMAILLAALTVWLLLPLTLAICIWALTFLALGAVTHLEQALYFSAVAFTTLGFGDIVLDTQWRILSSITATNGLILFALSTAFLIEALRQIGNAMGRAEPA